jgi:hypothetical protein
MKHSIFGKIIILELEYNQFKTGDIILNESGDYFFLLIENRTTFLHNHQYFKIMYLDLRLDNYSRISRDTILNKRKVIRLI